MSSTQETPAEPERRISEDEGGIGQVLSPKPTLTPGSTNKSQILGLPIQKALTYLNDSTHFGICELESIWEQFSRRTVVGKRIDKATFMEEMGHAFGMADPIEKFPTTEIAVLGTGSVGAHFLRL
eukprot:8422661-Pyramimonas_sp.AAC.1